MARRGLLLVVFLLSGAAGLIYQIVWARLLGQTFGTSTEAIAAVVAAFMGGFAIGGLWFGQRAGRWLRPLRAYAAMELLIAVLGVALTLGIPHLEGLSAVLLRATGESRPLQVAGLLVAVGLLLVLPTLLMGGTLPVLTRHLTAHGGGVGRSIAALYAANTAGAVAGCLLPDFWLVPALGLSGAAGVGVALNLAAAAGALWVGRGAPEAGEAPTPAPAPSSHEPGELRPDSTRRTRVALLVVAGSGLVAMGYEVVWSRIHIIFSGSQVFGFSVLLGVYLAGIALGSALIARRLDRTQDRLRLLGHLEVWIGVVVLASLWWLGSLDLVRTRAQAMLAGLAGGSPEGIGGRFTLAMLVNLVSSAATVLLPTVLMGMTVPVAARVVAEGRSTASAAIGRVYFWNTLAGIPGALAAGFLLLPARGAQWTLVALALTSVALGLVALIPGARRAPWRLGVSLLPAAALVAITVAVLPADHLMRSIFVARYGPEVTVDEGLHQTFAVTRTRFLDREVSETLYTDSYSMTARSFYASRYMKMMAHLPALLAEEPRRACLVGFGLGTTLDGLVCVPELTRIDVVDISPEVFDIYRDVVGGEGSLGDPRVQTHVADGRAYLLAQSQEEPFDVITLEPPPPICAGVVNLYSREFYRIGRSRLAPGGVMCQWLPLSQISPDEARAMVAAFVEVFPHAVLWHSIMMETILVGTPEDRPVDLGVVLQRMQASPRQEDLESIGMRDLADLVATVLLTPQALQEYAAPAAAVTDDDPLLPYSMRQWDENRLDAGIFAAAPDLTGLFSPPPAWDAPATGRFWQEVAGRRENFRRLYERMLSLEGPGGPAVKIARDDYVLADLLSVDPGNPVLLGYALLTPRRTEAARDALAADARNAEAHAYLGRLELYNGRPALARTHLQRALDAGVEDRAGTLFLLARSQTMLGQVPQARETYRQAQQHEPHPVFQNVVRQWLGALERMR